MHFLLLSSLLSLGVDTFPAGLLHPKSGLKESFISVTKSDLEGNNFGVDVTVAYNSTSHGTRSQCLNKCKREIICVVAVYCSPETDNPCFIGNPACSISMKPKVGSCHLMKKSSKNAAIPLDKVTSACGAVLIHPNCRETPTIKYARPSRLPRLVDDGVQYTYSCSRGFTSIQGSVTATCSKKGTWNKPVITCKPNGKLATEIKDTPFSKLAMASLLAGSDSSGTHRIQASKRRTSDFKYDLGLPKKVMSRYKDILQLRQRQRSRHHKDVAISNSDDEDEVKERTLESDPENRGARGQDTGREVRHFTRDKDGGGQFHEEDSSDDTDNEYDDESDDANSTVSSNGKVDDDLYYEDNRGDYSHDDYGDEQGGDSRRGSEYDAQTYEDYDNDYDDNDGHDNGSGHRDDNETRADSDDDDDKIDNTGQGRDGDTDDKADNDEYYADGEEDYYEDYEEYYGDGEDRNYTRGNDYAGQDHDDYDDQYYDEDDGRGNINNNDISADYDGNDKIDSKGQVGDGDADVKFVRGHGITNEADTDDDNNEDDDEYYEDGYYGDGKDRNDTRGEDADRQDFEDYYNDQYDDDGDEDGDAEGYHDTGDIGEDGLDDGDSDGIDDKDNPKKAAKAGKKNSAIYKTSDVVGEDVNGNTSIPGKVQKLQRKDAHGKDPNGDHIEPLSILRTSDVAVKDANSNSSIPGNTHMSKQRKGLRGKGNTGPFPVQGRESSRGNRFDQAINGQRKQRIREVSQSKQNLMTGNRAHKEAEQDKKQRRMGGHNRKVYEGTTGRSTRKQQEGLRGHNRKVYEGTARRTRRERMRN